MKSPEIYLDGISITSKLDLNKMVYRPRSASEIKKIIEDHRRQNQRPTGGVEDAVFDGKEYVSPADFKP